MFRLNIGGCIILSPVYQLACQIAASRANFKNTLPYKGLDRIRHPAVELRRESGRLENIGPRIHIKIVAEAVFQDYPDRLERIFQANLLTLLVGAPVITDRDLVNTCPPPGRLDGQFWLYAEALAADGNCLTTRCGTLYNRSPCRRG